MRTTREVPDKMGRKRREPIPFREEDGVTSLVTEVPQKGFHLVHVQMLHSGNFFESRPLLID